MKQQIHYVKIGVFVILSVVVLILGLVGINADALSDDAILMETYLNESVQGLEEGSALMHRGVDIGRVQKITFVPSEYPMDINSPEFKRYGRYVMVVVAVDPKKIHGMGDNEAVFKTMMRNQVREGMRLKLSYQGITGLCLLETEYDDPNSPYLEPPWTPKHLYIPAMPSLITSFTQAVDSVFQRLEHIDFEGLARQTQRVLGTLETAVRDLRLAEARATFDRLAGQIEQTNAEVQTLLRETRGVVASNVPATLHQLNRTLGRLEILLDESEPEVDAILHNLTVLSENLRDFSQTLKEDPASLFISRPPVRSEVVK